MDRRIIKIPADPSREECLSAIKMTLIRFNAFVQELDRQNYYSPGKFTAEHRDFLYEMAGRQYLGNMNAVLMGKQLEELDDDALKTVLEKCRRLSDGFGLCVDISKGAEIADGEESHEFDTYSDSTGMTVDYEFIRNHEGAAVLNGYVPQNADGTPIGRSGTTIASGFDLGQQNTYDLNRIFGRDEVNQDLRDAYSPYLGLQGNNAINYLNEHPLTITQEQANRTDDSVMTPSRL